MNNDTDTRKQESKEEQSEILRRLVEEYGVEEGLRRFQAGESLPSDWEKVLAERRKRIDNANVSEAAKEFYRKWHSNQYTSTGGWRDDYELIRELDDAGLVMTRLVFLEL